MYESPNEKYFLGYYEWTFENHSPSEIVVATMYFAITSLSTIGFGDLVPRSDLERLLGAFLLLSGVAIFTYVMGSFIDMLNEINGFNSEYNDGD